MTTEIGFIAFMVVGSLVVIALAHIIKNDTRGI
jgi:hypothetical protein